MGNKNKLFVEDSIALLHKIKVQILELITMSKSEMLSKVLKEHAEQIKYANPSVDKGIYELDSKISREYGNLKLSLSSGYMSEEALAYRIESLELLLLKRVHTA